MPGAVEMDQAEKARDWMFRKTNKLEQLQRQIGKLFKKNTSPEVRLLPDGQLLIFKNLSPNVALAQGKKTETRVPGAEGYEIYVAYRVQSAHSAATGTAQRVFDPAAQPLLWDASLMQLQIDPAALGADWELLNREGYVVTVRVQSGSASMRGEVNQILNEIAASLLG
jgi:hypothetical protein